MTPDSFREFDSRMVKLGIRKKDIREHFTCSPGKGGQNVNKVETAVVLTYLPTGLSVKCHEERTQASNRRKAWIRLLDKIEVDREQQTTAEIGRLEKTRRQKRVRSHLSKEKMLSDKKFRSFKKQFRRGMRDE